jgi:hypothetical protein
VHVRNNLDSSYLKLKLPSATNLKFIGPEFPEVNELFEGNAYVVQDTKIDIILLDSHVQ